MNEEDYCEHCGETLTIALVINVGYGRKITMAIPSDRKRTYKIIKFEKDRDGFLYEVKDLL